MNKQDVTQEGKINFLECLSSALGHPFVMSLETVQSLTIGI
jgi:hypothetical protein